MTTSPSRTARLTTWPMTFAERSTLRLASICPFAETLLVRSCRATLPNVTGVMSLPRRDANPAVSTPRDDQYDDSDDDFGATPHVKDLLVGTNVECVYGAAGGGLRLSS